MAGAAAPSHGKPAAKGQFAKRFSAWWEGREYSEGEEPPAAEAATPAPPAHPDADGAVSVHLSEAAQDNISAFDAIATQDVHAPKDVRANLAQDLPPLQLGRTAGSEPAGHPRIAALEAIWGAGLFVPGDPRIDMELAEALDLVVATRKTILTLGVNLPTLEAISDVTSARLLALDWREPCVARVQAGLGRLMNRISVKLSDIERMNIGVAPEGGFAGFVSVDAFTYADYKPGLVSQAFKLLRPGAVWAILDYVGETEALPAGAFASAWAQPQVCGHRTLPRLLIEGGFEVMSDDTATERLLGAANRAVRSLPARLDDFAAHAQGAKGALALRELAWELQTWRTRMRILGTRALEARLIIARRGPGV
jgi:hypothetical protein